MQLTKMKIGAEYLRENIMQFAVLKIKTKVISVNVRQYRFLDILTYPTKRFITRTITGNGTQIQYTQLH